MIRIYGASDDLIEIEGGFREEISAYDDGTGYLACSDGTLLSVQYTSEGLWRFNRLREGKATYSKVEATDPDDVYTDTVTLDGDVTWVLYGKDLAK